MTESTPLNPIAKPNVDVQNKGYDTKLEPSDSPPIIIGLETIDTAIFEYVQNVIKPYIIENETTKEVPTIMASPERWKSIQQDGFLRDKQTSKIQVPLILIRRNSISKDMTLTIPINKDLFVSFDKNWNNRNTYDRFAIQNNVKPSQIIRRTIIPDYIKLNYQILMWTEKIYQLNSLIEQINSEVDSYWGPQHDFKFRVKIEDYDIQSEVPADRERFVRTLFNLEVNGYLLPERMVKQYNLVSTNIKDYTVKKIIIQETIHNS